MFSQAGSVSDGVAWISSPSDCISTVAFPSYYDERTFSRKRDRRMHMQMARLL
jgi:hypothetical protein